MKNAIIGMTFKQRWQIFKLLRSMSWAILPSGLSTTEYISFAKKLHRLAQMSINATAPHPDLVREVVNKMPYEPFGQQAIPDTFGQDIKAQSNLK